MNTSERKTSGVPHIVLVGTGSRPYRQYALEALAGRYRLSALLPSEPTWQRRHLTDWRVTDLSDEGAVTAALGALAGPGTGVLTWDETFIEITALAARTLSLPHMSPDAAAGCRDKYRTRSLLAGTGPNAVRHGLARTAEEAAEIAASIGLPVVLKPRAQAGSIGVVLAASAEEVRTGFALADGSGYGTLPTGLGVLVEEYLDGPEVSVDSVVDGGEVTCVVVARKRLGFAPHFEEVGHLVTGWADEPWADELREVLSTAHRVLGVERGVTHAELRLTGRGPRLVELNGRLGGDLIPYAGQLATGDDLVAAAAELALGRTPDLIQRRQRSVEVRFAYPPHDGTVRQVDVTKAAEMPGIEHAAVLAGPGTLLRLPPRQVIPRLAVLVAAGPDPAACAEALDAAMPTVVADVEPLTRVGDDAPA